MSLNLVPTEAKDGVKSFWSRPEGTTGMLTIAALAVGGFLLAPTILAGLTTVSAILGTLVGIAANTILLVLLGIILFVILYVVTNKKFQMLSKYLFKSIMRKITGAFVEIDPIGIMKSYIDSMSEKRALIGSTRDKLRGQIKVLDEKITKNANIYETEMAKAAIAKQKGNTAALTVSSRQAIRMETLNKADLVPLRAQMDAHLRAANKYYEVTGTVIEDLRNEVEAQSTRREMIASSYSVMKAAKAIMMGGDDERELFDQALEYTVTDYGMKLGEIESFIENSKPFVDGLDMQNGVYEAEALKRLQEWEAKADSILLGNEKAKLLEQTATSGVVYTGIGVPAASVVDYAQLLKK